MVTGKYFRDDSHPHHRRHHRHHHHHHRHHHHDDQEYHQHTVNPWFQESTESGFNPDDLEVGICSHIAVTDFSSNILNMLSQNSHSSWF